MSALWPHDDIRIRGADVARDDFAAAVIATTLDQVPDFCLTDPPLVEPDNDCLTQVVRVGVLNPRRASEVRLQGRT
jgi:hypothetical protein